MTDSPLLAGLTEDEARRRLGEYGPNEIEDREKHGLLSTLKGVATEPMFLLLLVAAAIYLVLGDLGEGLLLAFFAVVTVGLVIFQERRSERALDALRELAAPQVRVVRAGRVLRIAARELVPGDLFLVGEGERVAADGVAARGGRAGVDESLLTGESVPVRKLAPAAGRDARRTAAGRRRHARRLRRHAGGRRRTALAEVAATGPARAARAHRRVAGRRSSRQPTPLQRRPRRLVRSLGLRRPGPAR